MKTFEAKLPAFLQKYNGQRFESEVFLQPLKQIHLSSNLRYETSLNASKQTIDMLSIIALLILSIAWINYINLSSAKVLERAKEIGVRKAIGASRVQLFFQFLTQAFLTHVFALIIALGLIGLLIPVAIFEISKGIIDYSLFTTFHFWLMATSIVMIGSILAGTYPAFLLSSYSPVEALKGRVKHPTGGYNLRKALVVSQFSISTILAIFTLIVIEQFHFMRRESLGINIDQTLVVKVPGFNNSGERGSLNFFKQQIVKTPQVNAVSFSTSIPGKEITTTRGIVGRKTKPKEDTNFFLIGADENYIDFYDLTLLSGKGFDKQFWATDQGKSVIINEQALEQLHFESPQEAIGEKVFISGKGPERTVIGVIKNYHNKSLDKAYEPIVLYKDSLNQGYLSLKLQSVSNLTPLIESIEDLYGNVFPGQPLDYFFLDDFFNQQYQSEQRNVGVFSSFAILAILIACLGMIGLTSYSIAGRMKEIAVRKVLGAHSLHVLRLLLEDLFQTIAISSVLAWPLAFLATSLYLEDYAFRMKLNPIYFIAPSIAVALFALLAIFYKTWKAAQIAPTAFLKDK